jgi:hypothetical protein
MTKPPGWRLRHFAGLMVRFVRTAVVPITHASHLGGKAHRGGLYYCADCNGQFTVTIGTVMESSHIPLSKWLFAMHLMGASKKRVCRRFS